MVRAPQIFTSTCHETKLYLQINETMDETIGEIEIDATLGTARGGTIGGNTLLETIRPLPATMIVNGTSTGINHEIRILEATGDNRKEIIQLVSVVPCTSCICLLCYIAPSNSVPPPKPGSTAEAEEEGEDMDALEGDDADMMAMMGIGGFGSTKVYFIDS